MSDGSDEIINNAKRMNSEANSKLLNSGKGLLSALFGFSAAPIEHEDDLDAVWDMLEKAVDALESFGDLILASAKKGMAMHHESAIKNIARKSETPSIELKPPF